MGALQYARGTQHPPPAKFPKPLRYKLSRLYASGKPGVNRIETLALAVPVRYDPGTAAVPYCIVWLVLVSFKPTYQIPAPLFSHHRADCHSWTRRPCQRYPEKLLVKTPAQAGGGIWWPVELSTSASARYPRKRKVLSLWALHHGVSILFTPGFPEA